MNLKYLSILLLAVATFLNIARTGAQDYFPVMDSVSEIKLGKVINMYNDTLFEDRIAAVLSREEYNSRITSSRNKWYSRHLKRMREPVLYSDSTDRQVIRFTWLRAFHNPVVVGMVYDEGSVFLYWKKTGGQGGYNPGMLVTNRKKRTDRQQWDEMIQKLEEIGFWKQPTNYPSFGLGGAQWILEAKIGGKYHIVDRWSGDNSVIKKLCLSLLSQSGLKMNKEVIY